MREDDDRQEPEMGQLSLEGFEDFPPKELGTGGTVLDGVVERIKMHLENSNRWGLMSNEEAISLCYLLLRLLDAPDADVKNALLSSLLGQSVQAENFSIGSQAMPRLLRKVLEQDLRQLPQPADDARIAGASSEQIALGFKEVRNALESQFLFEGNGGSVRVVSSDLLKYFPNFSKIVYGAHQ